MEKIHVHIDHNRYIQCGGEDSLVDSEAQFLHEQGWPVEIPVDWKVTHFQNLFEQFASPLQSNMMVSPLSMLVR